MPIGWAEPQLSRSSQNGLHVMLDQGASHLSDFILPRYIEIIGTVVESLDAIGILSENGGANVLKVIQEDSRKCHVA